MYAQGTIAAISSAVAPAARMIVRMSGSAAHGIAGAICDRLPAPGHAQQTMVGFGGLRLPAVVCLFASPRSYTTEDLVEFHIPGNPLLARMLLDALVDRGARHAEPGEFTARAYFAGRMDLTEAEGVAATIAAHGDQELRAARQLLSGELSRRLGGPMEQVAETLALVEAGIDFSDEDVSFLSAEQLDQRIAAVESALEELVAQSARFDRLAHEPTVVLVGRPNAGKSTLLNALAGQQRAIVSPVAGTTRDLLTAEVALHRGIVRIVDAAGIDPADTRPLLSGESARIADQMQQQALRAVESADLVLLIHDSTRVEPMMAPPREADVIVRTKGDLSHDETAVSALTGQGLRALREQLDHLAFGSAVESPVLALNARHLRAIDDARAGLRRARGIAQSGGGGELTALELRDALDSMGRVLGQVTPDDVIGRIFATFCIGK